MDDEDVLHAAEESKRSYQDFNSGEYQTNTTNNNMVGPEYHTFSLNPNQVNKDANIILEGHDYLAHGLAINSGSNRYTDMEEN